MPLDSAILGAVRFFYEIIDARTVQLERARSEVICPRVCSMCCNGSIFFVTALDFAYLCDRVDEFLDAGEKERVIETAMTQADRVGTELAEELERSEQRLDALPGERCPLLHQGRCTVYPARPTPCRLFGRSMFASGRLNVCDIIYDRLPAGGNGNPQGHRSPRLPVVEEYSKMLGNELKKRLGPENLAVVEHWFQVSTLPVLIARTKFDPDAILASLG